ncbi:CRNKL1 [Symbiodinium necroappetens]|uniref:CRNKL1 protein n=1 Tax=Symbiodinium necroappetens TaxID=1628268 RepID=A0A813AXX8_9DINO|nr:CRNKL1 [Symbiodinium necroappetens]
MVKEQTRNHKRTFAACTRPRSTRRLPGATDTAEMRATDLFLDYLEYLDFKAAEGDSLDASPVVTQESTAMFVRHTQGQGILSSSMQHAANQLMKTTVPE